MKASFTTQSGAVSRSVNGPHEVNPPRAVQH